MLANNGPLGFKIELDSFQPPTRPCAALKKAKAKVGWQALSNLLERQSRSVRGQQSEQRAPHLGVAFGVYAL